MQPPVPQNRRRERNLPSRQQVVRLNDVVDVVTMDADGDAHVKKLETLNDLATCAEQIRALEALHSMTANLSARTTLNSRNGTYYVKPKSR